MLFLILAMDLLIGTPFITCQDFGVGLEPAVFAALVPNSAEKPIQELIEEIMGDHEMMSAKRSG